MGRYYGSCNGEQDMSPEKNNYIRRKLILMHSTILLRDHVKTLYATKNKNQKRKKTCRHWRLC